MKVSIADIKDKMTGALKAKGYTDDDIPFIIEMYLGGELRGHKSHGLASFPGFLQMDYSGLHEPEVIQKTHASLMIDAKSNPGVIVGRRAADEAIKRAGKEMIGFVLIKNMASWMRPGAIAQYIVDKGFLAIVVNSGGGAFTAPPGGYDPVTGTNPMAYGIPTEDGSLVVDMATSKRAKGEVRLARKTGTDLPADTFYDDQGNVTLDPEKAWSVMPAGAYKGFALAFLFEVMCGSLVGMPMMLGDTAKDAFGIQMAERGAFILVVDPAQTTDPAAFMKANSEFIQRIKATRPRRGEKIRVPGDQASAEQAAKLKQGSIDLPEALWREIAAGTA